MQVYNFILFSIISVFVLTACVPTKTNTEEATSASVSPDMGYVNSMPAPYLYSLPSRRSQH